LIVKYLVKQQIGSRFLLNEPCIILFLYVTLTTKCFINVI